jgi:hypothetical protein
MYKEIISNIYFLHFKSYIHHLKELQVTPLNDFILPVDSPSIFSFFKKNLLSIPLEERMKILNSFQPIISHISKEKNEQFTFDYLFKSIFILLMEIASSEYLFLSDFFCGEFESIIQPLHLPSSSLGKEREIIFSNLFSNILLEILKEMKEELKVNQDILGILLMIKILKKIKLKMMERRIECLNEYLNKIHSMLSTRLKELLKMNIDLLLQRMKEIHSNDELVESEGVSNDLAVRYGYLSSCVHKLKEIDEEEENSIAMEMNQMRECVEKFFKILSNKFENSKLKYIWLINSSDIILNYYIKYSIECLDAEKFHYLLNESVNFFIEEELLNHCHDFILFTQKNEKLKKVNEISLIKIMNHFLKNWKVNLKNIHVDVLKYFKNLKSAKIILTKVYSQWLLYYSRFVALIYQSYSNVVPNEIKKLIVPHEMLLLEIKTYAK